jgi:hypothetical protein
LAGANARFGRPFSPWHVCAVAGILANTPCVHAGAYQTDLSSIPKMISMTPIRIAKWWWRFF